MAPTATDRSDWAGIMVTTHFGLVSGLFWATRDPKRVFLASIRPQNDVFGRFLQRRGPFLVESCFDRNIVMWGVQIVATEFSDDFRQLQLILNNPDGETVQKHHFGGLLEAKNALLGTLVAQKTPDMRSK